MADMVASLSLAEQDILVALKTGLFGGHFRVLLKNLIVLCCHVKRGYFDLLDGTAGIEHAVKLLPALQASEPTVDRVVDLVQVGSLLDLFCHLCPGLIVKEVLQLRQNFRLVNKLGGIDQAPVVQAEEVVVEVLNIFNWMPPRSVQDSTSKRNL